MQDDVSTHHIVVAKLDAMVITEVKFAEISLKMTLATVLVNAFHAAFENRKVTFNGLDQAFIDQDHFLVDEIVACAVRAVAANSE